MMTPPWAVCTLALLVAVLAAAFTSARHGELALRRRANQIRRAIYRDAVCPQCPFYGPGAPGRPATCCLERTPAAPVDKVMECPLRKWKPEAVVLRG